MSRRSIDDLVAELRRGYRRLEPAEAYARQQRGALIVDTRSPDEQREQGGLVPGAVSYPLSVVFWRLDPDVDSPNEKPALDRQVIVICRHGYSSSLAASWLREIGFERATDVVGGFEAWAAAGLPVEPIPPPA
jgi:rhodanese-related sulfurtransferase